MRFTPEMITTLKENEIFVFGSNVEGHHGGGAAYAALKKFGAIWGQAEGLQGQSYAIPTIDLRIGLRSIPLSTIEKSIVKMMDFAKTRPDLTFLVTKIGTALAGYELEEIAELFRGLYIPDNVVLPKEFWFAYREVQ